MTKFRKRPVVIEAMLFTDETKDQCFNFVRCNHYASFTNDGEPTLVIQTLEGDMTVSLGDWIIKGVCGEFYPCKPDVFEATYEPVLMERRAPYPGEIDAHYRALHLEAMARDLQDFWYNELPDILAQVSAGLLDVSMAHALIHKAILAEGSEE